MLDRPKPYKPTNEKLPCGLSFSEVYAYISFESLAEALLLAISAGLNIRYPGFPLKAQEYKQRPEYKQIWPIYIGILTEICQNPPKKALKICLKIISLAGRPYGRFG